MSVAWNTENAAHLLRRAGFEPRPDEVRRALKRGFDKTLKQLFKPDKKATSPPDEPDDLEQIQAWWIERMVTSKRPLTEKLTVFWHDHFATAIHKVKQEDRIFQHVETLRQHALGSFRDMLHAVTIDPAMLVWLDNKSNKKGSPNENFARELMELFTTGVLDKDGNPNYTETDVKEVARAFTGWSLKDGEFFFRKKKHDFGVKTVKGVTDDLDGDDVLDLLLDDPATARRIPARLWSFLAYPIELTDPICDELQTVYEQTGGQIRPIVEAILRHDAFYSDAAKQEHVKSPVEFLVGSLRLLRAKVAKGNPQKLGKQIQELGQSLFDPPSVFGWDGGLAWTSTAGMLARARVADQVAEARGKDAAIKFKANRLLGPKRAWKKMDAHAVVGTVLDNLGVRHVAPTTVDALATYVQADDSGSPQPLVVDNAFVDEKVRGLVALVFSSPEYQVA